MAINRFDQQAQYDWRFDTYVPEQFTPNVQLWGDLLQQLEKEKLAATKASNLSVNAIAQDVEGRDAYQAKNKAEMDMIANLYAAGDIHNARAAQNQMLSRIEKDFTQGGQAYGYESRYKQLAERNKYYDDLYKDDPGFMRQVAKRRIQQSINPNAWNESIGDPMMGGYVNIQEDMDKALKGFEHEGRQTFRGPDGRYYYVDTEKLVPEEAVNQFLDDTLSQPRFQEQLGIETESLSMFDNEAQMQANRDVYNKSLDANYNAALKAVNEASTSDLQAALLEAGYNIGMTTPNGKMTDATKAAKEEYLSDLEQSYNKGKNAEFSNEAFRMRQIKDQYKDPLINKYAYARTSTELRFVPRSGPSSVTNVRINNAAVTAQALEAIGTTTTSGSYKMSDISQVRKDNEATKTGLLNEIGAIISNSSVASIANPQDLPSILYAYNNATTRDEFAEILATKGIAPQSANIDRLYNYMSNSSDLRPIANRVEQLAGIQAQDEALDNQIMSLEQDLIMNDRNSVYKFWRKQAGSIARKLSNSGRDMTADTVAEIMSDPKFIGKDARQQIIEAYGEEDYLNYLEDHGQKILDSQIVEGESWTAKKGVVADQNAATTDNIKKLGVNNLVTIDGSVLQFYDVDNPNKTVSPSEVDITAATVTTALGRNSLYITGEGDINGTNRKVKTEATYNSNAGTDIYGEYGMQMYLLTFDDTGAPIKGSRAKNMRHASVMTVFNNDFDVDAASLLLVKPDVNAREVMNARSYDSSGNIITDERSQLGNATLVKSWDLPHSNGVKGQLYTKRQSDGSIVYIPAYMSPATPNKPSEVRVFLDDSGLLPEYANASSAIEMELGVTHMDAKLAIEGMREGKPKSFTEETYLQLAADN